jgi:hypothetical protein
MSLPVVHVLVTAAVWCDNVAMGENPDTPGQQLTVAWQIAASAFGQWRKQVAAATSEARDNLEPAVRVALEAARAAFGGSSRPCECPCATAHPHDQDVCDGSAILTWRRGATDVHLCAPCAVAQGVAEMPH